MAKDKVMITIFTIISVITSLCGTDVAVSFWILWLLRKGSAEVSSSAFVESLKDTWPQFFNLTIHVLQSCNSCKKRMKSKTGSQGSVFSALLSSGATDLFM